MYVLSRDRIGRSAIISETKKKEGMRAEAPIFRYTMTTLLRQ